MRTLLLALTGCLLSLYGSVAHAGSTGTSDYVFVGPESTILQTGGIAGVHWTYHIAGRFRLTINTEAGTASFSRVDAVATDDSPYVRTLNPNEVFTMTGLAGRLVDETAIRFEGKADDGSSISITLVSSDGTVTLQGQTTPPPHSADFFLFTLDAVAQRKYGGGIGTAADPYRIGTAEQMNAIGAEPDDWDEHFKLLADLDLSAFDGKEGRPTFNMIGVLTGQFDGNGHAISRLTIQGGGYLGLFGELRSRAEVKDLGVVDVNITGSDDYVGGLAGMSGALVRGCYSTGVVRGRQGVGGFMGENWGAVTNCYSTCTVSGDNGVGGLMGEGSKGSVSDCYSTGAVYSAGRAGGLAGYDNGKTTRCFWDMETSGQATSAAGTGKNTTEMRQAATFLEAGWDFTGETTNGTNDVWWIFDGRDYPRLAWERVLDDDFADGRAEPLWMPYEPWPEAVRLKEVNGRLEVEAMAQDKDTNALYVPNGWRLDATKDFALRVDFHFSKRGPGNGRVALGVVPAVDAAGMQWAKFEAGCLDTGPFFLYEVRDKSWVQEQTVSRPTNDGTLYLSYDSDADELYFSYGGYGKANAWQTVTGLLHGRWAAAAVYVILSGGSEGMALTAGDAWLDNLIVNAGVVEPVEPITLGGAETGDSL